MDPVRQSKDYFVESRARVKSTWRSNPKMLLKTVFGFVVFDVRYKIYIEQNGY